MTEQMPVLKEPVPKKRGNKKIIIILIVLFIVILCFIFFNSSLSKISEIQITGTQYTKIEDVSSHSGIEIGDSFFGSSVEKIKSNVEKIITVKQATVTKMFPGIVKISVNEHDVVAYELTSEGIIHAILASGVSMPTLQNIVQIMDKPILTGWSQDDQYKKQLVGKLIQIPDTELTDISEITPIPSTAYPDRILIYTRTKFEVITAVSVLVEKIEAMNAVIETQEPGKITMLLADTYVPFSTEDSMNE